MLRYLFPFVFALLAGASPLLAQGSFPPSAPSDPREKAYALTNATIYKDYQTRIEGATLLIRKGKIEACGQKVLIPADAVRIDCSGKTIYPAFIDLYAGGVGLGSGNSAGSAPQQTQPGQRAGSPRKEGAYIWNMALHPEFDAADQYRHDEKAAEEWRKYGFGLLLTHRPDGIMRGSGALVALHDGRPHDNLLRSRASAHYSFRKGASPDAYPSSLMGCIALLRQTYYDADWYKTEGYKREQNLGLQAWNELQNLPAIFEASDKLDLLRVGSIAREFNTRYILKTSGNEYQCLDEVKALGMPLILSLNFPESYDIRNPYDALQVSLAELKHWEMAPANPARVAAAGIPFALTAADLKDKSKFIEHLRKAIEYGLSETDALKALTWQPAQLLGIYQTPNPPFPTEGATGVGSLEPGKLANFIVTTGNVFQKDVKILENWNLGTPYPIAEDKSAPDLYGDYQLSVGAQIYTLTVKEKNNAPDASLLRADSTKTTVTLQYKEGLLNLSFQPDSAQKTRIMLAGTASGEGRWSGKGTLINGEWIDWSAQKIAPYKTPDPQKEKPVSTPELGDVIYPFAPYGQKTRPGTPGAYLIRNATVWTGEREGILQNTDVLIQNGKITRIGRNLPLPDKAVEIDGAGKHLAAGIIDEHSHIAISRGVNEGTQESSAEVRIGDVINSEDVNIYRHLAGGVTATHLLHGSANPIGGQSQLIKMRWGKMPEELKMENWTGQIKFALGENVKQSNWGDNFRTRYPQTRMGVEQVYEDYFTRAREYGALKKSGKPYRRDIELEALLEILEAKRFITCHSYVQSEIVMLMRVAERFGFRINTFTHILEGYKVADIMAKHGAGGSTFSDWWAYKFEVYQAIPHNAKMMADQGVVVAVNSDDAEMARRLNQEAAKAVMYGGMSEEEAWKTVTLNPAKLLRVDDRIGSVKVGKDADLALWNDRPLSIYARVEKTWVDGYLYYDAERDRQTRREIQAERARIIQKMLEQGKGQPGNNRPAGPRHEYHCDHLDDEGNEERD
ncbi:MAG: amidohydrolase family protein [Saprospiraceae bacterium]